MGHSVLAVPVPALEEFVRARWEHYEPAWVSADPSFTHAHITVLAPFVESPTDRDLAVLAALAARTPRFGFRLEQVLAFPNGIIHSPPVPGEPFARLTAEVRRAYPELLPYAGEFEPVPHLTLDHTTPEITPAAVARSLRCTLPVSCRAERLELHRYAEGDCRVLASWPLG